jgi:hypothetical protein
MADKSRLKAITRHLVARVNGPKQAAHICDVSEAEVIASDAPNFPDDKN